MLASGNIFPEDTFHCLTLQIIGLTKAANRLWTLRYDLLNHGNNHLAQRLDHPTLESRNFVSSLLLIFFFSS